MIYIKKHESERGAVIAMCDEELLGSVITEGKRMIDLKTHANFYKGRLVTEEEAAEELDSAVYSANIVGKRSVRIVIEKGLASDGEVMQIGNVEILQLYSLA
jgi:hypothetical protein